MSSPDDLLDYYQRELRYLREAGGAFARSYPKVAARLQVGAEGSPDPHVERLIEAFAYIAARVQRSIDAEFPRLTDALLGTLYPQLAAPVPAMGIARFSVEAAASSGTVVPRALAISAATEDGLRCRFRTCYETTLWPIRLDPPEQVTSDPWGILDRARAASAIRLTLRGSPESLAGLARTGLRFFLGGAPADALLLTDTLIAGCDHVAFVGGRGAPVVRSKRDSLRQVGFADNEAVLPEGPNGHPAYRLLQEYFAFPEKFRFFDLLAPAPADLPDLVDGNALHVLLVLQGVARGRLSLSADSLQLGCTPVINLFPAVAEPIRLDYRRSEYRVVPDTWLERVTEVHSVTAVHGNTVVGNRRVEYAPYFSVDHVREHNLPVSFWTARRQLTGRADTPGTDTWLSVVDLSLEPTSPAEQTVLVHALCTNRLLPEQVPVGAALEPEQPASGSRGILVTPLTTPRPAPPPGGTPWRLVSQLSLNHLSLTDGPGALAALQEILRLYAPDLDEAAERQIQGLRSLNCRHVVRRIGAGVRTAPVQGLAIDLHADERHFAGSSALLLASVLERFFCLYVTLNTFTELSVSSVQRHGIWHAWPPRAGEALRA
jgi:type VI secretion system protein ImpG